MNKVSQISAMASEDFIDEAVSGFTYLYADEAFKPLLESIGVNENDSVLQEALTGAIMTLKFGVMNAVIITVTEYVMTKSSAFLIGTIAYIKGMRVLQTVKNSLSGTFSRNGRKGKIAGKAFGKAFSIVTGAVEERYTIAKIANSSSNNLFSAVGQERQNQIMIRGYQHRQANHTVDKAVSLKESADNKYVAIFSHKTMTGTWLNTAEDKRIYEKATNTKVQQSGTATWSVLYEKLNKYSSFAQTANGEILNNVQASIKLLEKAGAKMS